MSNKKNIFLIRMSSIGDVIIAVRNVQYFVKNGYDPIFVTALSLRDILLKVKGLNHFICFDEMKTPHYFLNQTQVSNESFKNYLNLNEDPYLICDFQNTLRSKKVIAFLSKMIFVNKKIIVNKVKKNFLCRIFLLARAKLHQSQKTKLYPEKSTHRVHDLQLNLINKIFLKNQKRKVNHSKTIYLHKGLNTQLNPYICLFPGASGLLKQWPKEHYRILFNTLLENKTYDIYLCGGAEDKHIGDFIISNLPPKHKDRVYHVMGQHSLGRTLNLIAHAAHIFCNDSFACHAADAYQVPATVVFGSTTPDFGFVPLSPSINIHYKNLTCSPCSRHGKGKCRFANLKCLVDINPSEIIEEFISKHT